VARFGEVQVIDRGLAKILLRVGDALLKQARAPAGSG
jgi:hypothetical protein